jgi:transposase
MGQRSRILAQVLGFVGFRVVESYFENSDGARVWDAPGWRPPPTTRLVLRIERKWAPRCGDCGAVCRRIKERLAERGWDDLPWAEHAVQLRYAAVRVKCERCHRARVEHLGFAEAYQRQTKRLQQRVALAASSSPVMHVAAQYGLSWGTVRRAEVHALERWACSRPVAPLRYVGVDEKYLGRRNRRRCKFVTIVSNLENGEPIWIGDGRERETLEKWFATLTPEAKSAIKLFAVDMFDAYRQAILGSPEFAHAALVHDPFHIVKRAGEAVDEVRRRVFFRAGAELRSVGRGKRWLFLRGSEKLSDAQREELRVLLSMNRRLAHAYQVKEELRYVVTHAATRDDMEIDLRRLLSRTQRRNDVPMRKLHDSLVDHRDAILALAEHRPPTGRIEALNNNWETLVRRGRGYRDLDHMLLKLRFAVVNPVRTTDTTRRFLALGLPVPFAA